MRLRMWQKALPEITNCSGQLGECATGERYRFIEYNKREHESRI